MDQRADRLRRAARLKAVQQELLAQEEEEKLRATREKKVLCAQRDEALANALLEQQRNDLKQKKLLQLVHDHPELQELKAKIRAAYVAKERALQIKEHENQRLTEKNDQKEQLEVINANLKRLEEEEKERLLEKQRETEKRNDAERLQQEWRQQLAAQEEEARRRERKEVDSVVAKVQENEFLELLGRVEKQNQIRRQHFRISSPSLVMRIGLW